MQELELAESDPRINFAQLLGMYDQVTYPLGKWGTATRLLYLLIRFIFLRERLF